MKSKGLGRGLRALIPDVPEGIEQIEEVLELPPDKIEPGPYQTRRDFNEGALADLAASIKAHGVMQPVVVRPIGEDRYQLIIGERRWRASKIAGVKVIPAIIRKVDDRASSEMMLVENIQRENLNPLEEAQGYKRLIDEFSLTQEEISQRVGKSRPFIANTIRLLQLPVEIQKLLVQGVISAGHGKVLLGLPKPEQQLALAQAVALQGLSVRETEQAAQRIMSLGNVKPGMKAKTTTPQDVELADIETQLKQLLGTRVKIKSKRRGGSIEIQYYSQDELTRLLEWFTGDLSR